MTEVIDGCSEQCRSKCSHMEKDSELAKALDDTILMALDEYAAFDMVM